MMDDKSYLLSFWFLTFSVLVTLVACSEKSNEDLLRKVSLNHVESIYLPLDSLTTSNNAYYQVLETDSGTYLTFLNPLVNALYTYDLQTREVVKKVSLSVEGPDGMGQRITAFNILSQDSILFHSYYQRKIFLTNGKGQVLKKYPLVNKNEDKQYAESGKGAGLVKIGNQIFIDSGMGCSTQTPEAFLTQYALKLSDGTLTEFLPVPQAYKIKQKTYWPRKYCNIYKFQDSIGDRVFYSFPGDEQVYVVDSELNIEPFVMGEGYLGSQRALPVSRFPSDPMSKFRSFLTFNRFGRIHVDPYNGFVFRSFSYKTPDELLQENILRSEMSLLIADLQFNMIGEAEFIGSDELFFTKRGMHQVLFNSTVEDSLEIRVFEYGF